MSILFSVLFGGILLSINLKKINNGKAILPVMACSIVYTVAAVMLLNMIKAPGALTLGLNAAGGFVLYNYFWKKYIGENFAYRTKPFWIPLAIGILITALFIYAMISGQGQ